MYAIRSYYAPAHPRRRSRGIPAAPVAATGRPPAAPRPAAVRPGRCRAAAMRYTEARTTDVTEMLLEGINEDAIDFRFPSDGETKEPEVLPAIV